ncbi:YceD family protein [Streptococcus sp. S784/96/1]|uniref:YceD family protein n=1 Tax=Streptococcus sp. S784/96/1 TaxID=2653499 RepID=UPI00138A5687|nr:YceD family protein [Streptococcus sp. S784/96/1]
MFNLIDLKKQTEGIAFDRKLDIKEALLERDCSILDITDVRVTGHISYDAGLYLLNYQLSYTITLPSSRSMEAVVLNEILPISEVFIEEADAKEKAELVEEDLVLVVEGETISLEESVVDNILLNIPLRVLTSEEERDDQMPSGNAWTVLTEEQYQAQQEEKAAANNPFASLNGLFDE